MIREARIADRIGMVRLGRAFHEASGVDLPWDAAWAERTARLAIEAEDRLALVLETDGALHGVLAARIGPHPLWPVTVACEDLWWIDPQHRGRWWRPMLAAYEAWSEARGCALIGMAARDDRTGRLYERCGYRRAETHFAKVA